MTRRCSHCSINGHNSRTCPGRGGTCGGVKLFGVRLAEGGSIIKKSASMGNLSSSSATTAAAGSPNPGSPLSDHVRDSGHVPDGYLSDDPAHGSGSSSRRGGDRKKGVPWTEEEHRLFLIGLQKLGKGDWRGIARNYVTSRTPTQVASHAQKYFIRQSNSIRRKRRSSLFDMVPDDMVMDTPTVPEEQPLPLSPKARESNNANSLPSLDLSLKTETEPMEASTQETTKESEETTVTPSSGVTQMVPGFFPAYVPVPYPFWAPSPAPPKEEQRAADTSQHQVLKPVPILAKEPVNVDELVGMSQLSIGEKERGQSQLSLKLSLGEPSRQSAFHANAPVSGSDIRKGNDAIQAV